MEKSIKVNNPSLFGILNSNRDFSKKDSWSKNKFNSSFPASLIAYMSTKDIKCVYLKLGESGNVEKDYISGEELFLSNPLDENLFYSFESSYITYQPYSIGRPPTVDLMLMKADTAEILTGYEVKLTTLPDESSWKLSEDKQGCELVIRMPSIHFLACSLASIYKDDFAKLKHFFGKNGYGNVSSYMEAAQINPRIGDIWDRMRALIHSNIGLQKPAMIQPIWKTEGKSTVLANNCLDVFVWSDLAFTQLFMNESVSSPLDQTVAINRPTRALIQLFFMLNEVSVSHKFNHSDILQKLTYTMKNDKAFSVSGRKTNKFMACEELLRPRISKYEIKNIILGGGENMLSPERRFDAALVNSPELFV